MKAKSEFGSDRSAVARGEGTTTDRESLLALRWHRIRGGWRCKVGIHRWRGHEDCGDSVNVRLVSGYRKPGSLKCWRVCDWCGARSTVAAIYDVGGRSRVLRWAKRRG